MLRSSFLNVRRARGSFGVPRRKGLGWLFRSLVMLFATRNGPEERASCLRQLARLTLVSWRVVSPEITVTRNLSTASRTQCACDTPGLRSCCPTSAAGRIWSCEAGLGVRPRGRGARGAGRPAPPAGRRGPCTAGLRPFSAHAAPGARRRLFHSARCRRSVWCYVSWNRPKGPWGSARGSGNAGDQAGQAACSFPFNPCVPLSLTEIIMSPILFVVYMSKMF